VKRLIAKALYRAGYVVFNARSPHGYARDGLYTMHGTPFANTKEFRAAYARGVAASQGIDPKMEWRVHVALWAASLATRAAGDFVECGVNAGFVSSAIMQSLDWNRLTPGRRFFLIDTFQGPVLEQYSRAEIDRGRDAVARSAISAGAYVTDMDRVRATFSEWPTAMVVQGTVPAVLDTLRFGDVAFVHLDMNCAMPERAALEFFWLRLSPGGVILFDDYTYFGHENQREAIDLAAASLGIKILGLPTGQGLIVK
jgi:hypothetical protein